MPDPPKDISEAIEQNAKGPRRVQSGKDSVEQHSIQDQIAADNHQAAKKAGAKAHFGLRFTQIIPPGGG